MTTGWITRDEMTDLSVIIPARCEMFLARTVSDILENAQGDTEVIAVLDGEWSDPSIPKHDKVTVLYYPESIGQRAACNKAVAISDAKYIMKVDAHCAFDEGFDVKMMADMQDNWTFVPVMKNLHVFDWVCEDGHRRYQGKSGPCRECGKETTRDVVWRPKPSPNSTAYRFDNTLHFQYWGGYKKRQKGDIVDTMSIQGSCFMVTRDKWLELGLCDEKHGSWGQQGVEIACKTWLSGGEVKVNKKTWYAHMFRTQGGDFGFPYPNPGITKARRYSRDLWFNNKWPLAIHDLQWLIDKFAPVPDWELSKSLLYYTDNQLDIDIMDTCQRQLRKCARQNRIVSVSLEPLDFGDNVPLALERGNLTMFKQILAGLEELETDVVFFCEHDVLYHPSHFDFIPPEKDKFYYNTNVWKLRLKDGHAMRVTDCRQTSGLCAYKELLVEHYRKRVAMVEENGFSKKMGFEPGTHGRAERVDDYKSDTWESHRPNIDIRHDKNLTSSRWSKDKFRNKRYTEGWTESDNIPGWGSLDWFWGRI